MSHVWALHFSLWRRSRAKGLFFKIAYKQILSLHLKINDQVLLWMYTTTKQKNRGWSTSKRANMYSSITSMSLMQTPVWTVHSAFPWDWRLPSCAKTMQGNSIDILPIQNLQKNGRSPWLLGCGVFRPQEPCILFFREWIIKVALVQFHGQFRYGRDRLDHALFL